MRFTESVVVLILCLAIADVTGPKDTNMCYNADVTRPRDTNTCNVGNVTGPTDTRIHHSYQYRGQRGGRIRHIKPLISDYRKPKPSERSVNYSNLIKIPMQTTKLNQSVFGTVNARSLRKNLDNIKTVVSHDSIDILSITETWLTEFDTYESRKICPDGYQFLRRDREHGKGGGVGFLLRNSFNASTIQTSSFNSFEHLAVRIATDIDVLRMVVVYRPPAKSLPTFMDEFTVLLEELALGGCSILISGDFNIHFDNGNNTYTTQFAEICKAFGIVQNVNEATHIKGHTVDFILHRSCDKLKVNNVQVRDLISDHHLVSCELSIDTPVTAKRTIVYRNLKSIDTESFRKDILELDLSKNYMDLQLEPLAESYDDQLRRLLDKHAPVISRTTAARKREPWMNSEVFQALRDKRRAERLFKKTKSTESRLDFSAKRNTFNRILSESKSSYLSKTIEKNAYDSKKLYQALNKVMHKSKPNPMPPNSSAKELAKCRIYTLYKGCTDRYKC